jgi:hypothetical protein
VAARASLSVAPTTVAFADADPTGTPVITAAGITVTARARTSAGNNVTLDVQSDGDFETVGGDVIAASNLTWTTAGAGFVAGTMSSAAAQPLGSWPGSGLRTATQTYALANSWDYAVGDYTMIVTYTLTAP